MDHLSKFHLNRTINEPGNVVLQKLHERENGGALRPEIRSLKPEAWQYKTSIERFLFCKNTKNIIFRESEHPASLVWCLAAMASPGGSYCSRNPEISSAPANFIHFALPSRRNPKSYIPSNFNPSHALQLHLKAS